MKKILSALVCFLPLCSFGQISLRPFVGGGVGTASQKGLAINREGTGLFIQNAGLSAVYWLDNWFVSAGVGYLTSGFKYDLGTLTEQGINGGLIPVTNAEMHFKYDHLTIPISVGRTLKLQRLSLIPETGIDLAYNLSERTRFRADQYADADYTKNEQFSTDFRRLSVFASMSLTAGYKLSDRLTVFCGPSYKYMVTNIVKDKASALTGKSISQNHHAMLLNAGVYIGLSK